jgi:hypothetical protein
MPQFGPAAQNPLYFDSAFAQTCYTSCRIRLFASSGFDFQEGFLDLPVRRIELAF